MQTFKSQTQTHAVHMHVNCQLFEPFLVHTSGVEGSTFTEGGNVFVFDTDKASLSADKSWSKTHNPTF